MLYKLDNFFQTVYVEADNIKEALKLHKQYQSYWGESYKEPTSITNLSSYPVIRKGCKELKKPSQPTITEKDLQEQIDLQDQADFTH